MPPAWPGRMLALDASTLLGAQRAILVGVGTIELRHRRDTVLGQADLAVLVGVETTQHRRRIALANRGGGDGRAEFLHGQRTVLVGVELLEDALLTLKERSLARRHPPDLGRFDFGAVHETVLVG